MFLSVYVDVVVVHIRKKSSETGTGCVGWEKDFKSFKTIQTISLTNPTQNNI